MNKDRRLRVTVGVRLCEIGQELIREAEEQEREAYDNLPESLQMSERGERMDEMATLLDDAAGDIMNGIEMIQYEDDLCAGDVTIAQLVDAVKGNR